jgi:DNA-directed RNA polymerase specialized sigma24 family protein
LMLEEKLWLWKLRRGDAEALRHIYDRYKHDMLGLAVSLSGDRTAGEDTVHDVFVSFVRRAPELRLRTSLRSYLLSSVANRVRNARKSDTRRPQQIWEQARQTKEASQWVQGYEITGEPYPEGDVWFLPTQLKMANGQTEPQTIMIKFYDFDGAKRCFSIGSKEKGVVD